MTHYKILVLNGPNINMLGIREPHLYGTESYDDLISLITQHAQSVNDEQEVTALSDYSNKATIELSFIQSNHEGDLVDALQNAYFKHTDGIIFNPAAYTHTSIALADALKAISIPTIEVHISKVETREAFRQVSYVRPYCIATITGQGLHGYTQALDILMDYLQNKEIQTNAILDPHQDKNIIISAGEPQGIVSAPPSKSHAHRLIIAAALSAGESVLRNVSLNDDIRATLSCISSLGAHYQLQNDVLTIQGIDPLEESCSLQENEEDLGAESPATSRMKDSLPRTLSHALTFDCNESGSTLRFMMPLGLVYSDTVVCKGTPRLIERGVSIYEEALSPHGISFEKNTESITAKGQLQPGNYQLRGNVSSQFITGLLFALPLLPESSTLTLTGQVESRPYIDLSLAVLSQAGISIKESSPQHFLIPGSQRPLTLHTSVEGDWSNSAFLLAFNYLNYPLTSKETPLSPLNKPYGMKSSSYNSPRVNVTGLNPDSLQADHVCMEFFKEIKCPSGKTIDISNCPDLAPILFALAASTGFGAHFTGTKRLKIKESNRAEAMKQELAKCGVRVFIEENSVIIPPSKLYQPTEAFNCHNDHRIAMALSVIATLTSAQLNGIQCVAKSFPSFFEVLESLHITIDTV